MKVLIGEQERQRLEFTGRDALQDRKEIAKEVVAFLNSEGGDVYIGVREEDERAVAIEAIADAEVEAVKLRDSLLDSIEPRPSPGEIEVTSEPSGDEGPILRVKVSSGKHRPYALLGKGGSRRFYVRIESSNRPMTREELTEAFSGSERAESPVAQARRALVAERDELQRGAKDWFWIAIQPARELELDVQEPGLNAYLSDPEAIGVPRGGASFHVPFEPELRQGELVARAIPFAEEVKKTVIRKDGGIRFDTVIHHLYQHSRGSTTRWINPEVLAGLPLSLFKLAGAVLEGRLEGADLLVVDLALLGVGKSESFLMPGRWRLPGPARKVGTFDESQDLTLIEPLTFTFGEIVETPEWCVFRLLRPVYESFGLREDAIPFPSDCAARRVPPYPSTSPRSS